MERPTSMMFGEDKVLECWSRRRRKRNIAAPAIAPPLGATMYIHMFLNFHERIAGPNDLAGFIDPPETGLHKKINDFYIRKKRLTTSLIRLISEK